MAATKSDLIDVIEFEIRRLESRRREGGWTPWLLWAAGAGLVWQALGQWERVSNWEHAISYWSVLTLSGDVLRSLIGLLRQNAPTETRRASSRFYSSIELLSATRPYLLFFGATIAAASLWIFRSQIIPRPLQWIWALFYGGSVLGTFSMFFLSWGEWPLATGAVQHTGIRRTVGAVTWLAQAIAIGLLFFGIKNSGLAPIDTEAAKLAVIAFALTYIVAWLLLFPVHEPTTNRLIQIRRALTLGDITVDDARQRIEIVLYGADQSIILRRRLQECLTALDVFVVQCDAAEALILRLTHLIADDSRILEPRTEAELNELKRQVRAADKAFETAQSKHINFESRALVMSTSDGNSPELQVLRDGLDAQLKDAQERAKKLRQSLTSLTEKADERVREINVSKAI